MVFLVLPRASSAHRRHRKSPYGIDRRYRKLLVLRQRIDIVQKHVEQLA